MTPPDLAAPARECVEEGLRERTLTASVLAALTLSHTAGRAEGLEEAAKWHETIAENHERLEGESHAATAYRHRFYAACLRALASFNTGD